MSKSALGRSGCVARTWPPRAWADPDGSQRPLLYWYVQHTSLEAWLKQNRFSRNPADWAADGPATLDRLYAILFPINLSLHRLNETHPYSGDTISSVYLLLYGGGKPARRRPGGVRWRRNLGIPARRGQPGTPDALDPAQLRCRYQHLRQLATPQVRLPPRLPQGGRPHPGGAERRAALRHWRTEPGYQPRPCQNPPACRSDA